MTRPAFRPRFSPVAVLYLPYLIRPPRDARLSCAAHQPERWRILLRAWSQAATRLMRANDWRKATNRWARSCKQPTQSLPATAWPDRLAPDEACTSLRSP